MFFFWKIEKDTWILSTFPECFWVSYPEFYNNEVQVFIRKQQRIISESYLSLKVLFRILKEWCSGFFFEKSVQYFPRNLFRFIWKLCAGFCENFAKYSAGIFLKICFAILSRNLWNRCSSGVEGNRILNRKTLRIILGSHLEFCKCPVHYFVKIQCFFYREYC